MAQVESLFAGGMLGGFRRCSFPASLADLGYLGNPDVPSPTDGDDFATEARPDLQGKRHRLDSLDPSGLRGQTRLIMTRRFSSITLGALSVTFSMTFCKAPATSNLLETQVIT